MHWGQESLSKMSGAESNEWSSDVSAQNGEIPVTGRTYRATLLGPREGGIGSEF